MGPPSVLESRAASDYGAGRGQAREAPRSPPPPGRSEQGRTAPPTDGQPPRRGGRRPGAGQRGCAKRAHSQMGPIWAKVMRPLRLAVRAELGKRAGRSGANGPSAAPSRSSVCWFARSLARLLALTNKIAHTQKFLAPTKSKCERTNGGAHKERGREGGDKRCRTVCCAVRTDEPRWLDELLRTRAGTAVHIVAIRAWYVCLCVRQTFASVQGCSFVCPFVSSASLECAQPVLTTKNNCAQFCFGARDALCMCQRRGAAHTSKRQRGQRQAQQARAQPPLRQQQRERERKQRNRATP